MTQKTMILLTVLTLAACRSEESAPEPGGSQSVPREGPTASVAGIGWMVPERWTTGPEKQMRVATYLTPAAGGDSEGGECAVFYFGPGEGGDVESNIARWIGQFDVEGAPARTTRTIDGMNVHLLDLQGTYRASAGPMMGSSERKEGFRLLGAIVGGPQGSVFFKFTGPEGSVAEAEPGFYGMIESLSTL